MLQMNLDQPTQPSTTNKDDSTFPSHCLVYLFYRLWAQSTSNPFPSSSSSPVSSCPVSVSVVCVIVPVCPIVSVSQCLCCGYLLGCCYQQLRKVLWETRLRVVVYRGANRLWRRWTNPLNHLQPTKTTQPFPLTVSYTFSIS